LGQTDVIDTSAEPMCKFGNLTLEVGERLTDSETPCEECHCSTPPELTCVTQSCPPPPMVNSAICRPEFVHGQCCPNYGCVSANPPSIDVCEVKNKKTIKLLDYFSESEYYNCWFETSRKSFATRTSTVKFKPKKAKTEAGCHQLVSA